MSEHDTPGELDPNDRLNQAMQAVGNMLDADGHIDYQRFNEEKLAMAEAEIGLVRHLAPQEAIHERRVGAEGDAEEKASLTAFMQEQNNFYFFFYTSHYLGEAYRSFAPAKRFMLLFPELDQALCDMTPSYVAAQKRHEGADDAYASGLRLAYAVMSQLVDQNDTMMSGKVKDQGRSSRILIE